MAKPTSLAAQLKRDDEAAKIAEAKEDAAIAAKPAAEGKVWVRLVRPHYDSEGVLHAAGVVQLDADKVPKTAKVLSKEQAVAELKADDEDEDEDDEDDKKSDE